MKSVLTEGVCVSCGRWTGRYYWVCPFCDEQVWHSVWWRIICVLLVGLPACSVVMLLLSCRPGCAEISRTICGMAVFQRFVCALGVGMLLMPYADDGYLVTSRRRLVRWQGFATCGGVLAGGCSSVLALCLACGKPPGVVEWTSAVLAMLCILSVPFFVRLPWRAVIGALFLFAAIVTA